jgi:hypothetical protein
MLVIGILVGIPLLALIVSPLFRGKLRAGGRVFALHSLRPLRSDSSAISVASFERLVETVRNRGLRIGSIGEAVNDSGVVAITFDDGYDDLLLILPYLVAQRIPITVFMPTAVIGKTNCWDSLFTAGRRRHLDELQIKQLAAAGVRFGAHTHRHVDLTLLSDQQIEQELTESRRILRLLTGQAVDYLAYPFGNWNSRVVAIARKAGFANGLTTTPAHIRAGEFNVGRIAVNRFDNWLTLTAKVQPNIFSGAEYLKSLIISRLSHLTPIYLRLTGRRAIL